MLGQGLGKAKLKPTKFSYHVSVYFLMVKHAFGFWKSQKFGFTNFWKSDKVDSDNVP
jgi:hypothetical protein